MVDYLTTISAQLGVPIWLFIVILIWSGFWKLMGLWRSAKNNSLIWFIVIGVTNTVGILPILYIYVFSKMKKSKAPARKKVSKKIKRKRK